MKLIRKQNIENNEKHILLGGISYGYYKESV